MPRKPPRLCPRCRSTVTGPECPTCRADYRRRTDADRGTAADRGYDRAWQRNRAAFLAEHPLCALCPTPTLATVADHHPTPRRDLVTAGDPDPDAWHHLRPLCKPCHDRETARLYPAGWAARRPPR